jgi:hypothetical protein
MHPEVLDPRQKTLLPWIKQFKRSFYLVGGTAVALHLGHRRSIDFDLFAAKPLVKHRIKNALRTIPFPQAPIFEDVDQLHIMLNGVKTTFFYYPYNIEHPEKINSFIEIPTLLSLAAIKAFALGRRSKWKDYVDLYFMLKDHITIQDISEVCLKTFPGQYSEKLFREQLAFHKDIDYSEPVEFLGPEINENEIREFLIEQAIRI